MNGCGLVAFVVVVVAVGVILVVFVVAVVPSLWFACLRACVRACVVFWVAGVLSWGKQGVRHDSLQQQKTCFTLLSEILCLLSATVVVVGVVGVVVVVAIRETNPRDPSFSFAASFIFNE
jgi:hypothetical protein